MRQTISNLSSTINGTNEGCVEGTLGCVIIVTSNDRTWYILLSFPNWIIILQIKVKLSAGGLRF